LLRVLSEENLDVNWDFTKHATRRVAHI